MKTGYLHEAFKNVICEDIPNLGSIITLDNKGRLINSQFSKPSSSQTLLKLNSTDEVPDADDLPYGIISYGDTPNLINLPYNDHNYASVHYSKKLENYDRKALDYISKQSSQSSNRSNFPTSSSVRISHFSSYNTSVSHNDSVFFADKYKQQHQFTFNQQVSHCSTPIVSSKTISSISQNNNIYSKNKMIPSAIVINSGTVNKLKSMNVIKLRRPTIDANNIGETRIINLPMKKPSVLTNIIGNNQINGDREGNTDKTDLSKSINLIPRCVCGFTHDDGGMIRCEICRTWQHIVCMYPDNKFPIYYKCERCEPRDVDIKRAIATQKNVLLKTGYVPSDLVVQRDYDPDNDLENKFVKPTNSSHFVFVQPDSANAYAYRSESMSNTSLPIFLTSSKDSQTVPPGSPRTSKRKQDLISLKTVLGKPTLNVSIVTNRVEPQKPLLLENPSNYNTISGGYIVPTSTYKLLSEARDISYPVNELSQKLKAILSSRLQYHTNMTVYHLQYLKQNSFTINTNMYEVVSVDCSQYAVKTIVEFNSNEVIMEFNGYVSLADEYNKEWDFRKHYNPFVLFYDKYDHLQLSIDSKSVDNKAKYVRRSCTPNSEVKHRLLQDGQIRFYVVPINRICKDSEITIAFDYNFLKCRYSVTCACNQPSCQLIYLNQEMEAKPQRVSDDTESQNMNIYECTNVNLGLDTSNISLTVSRPYKKRGRGSKILNNPSRPNVDNSVVNAPKSSVKIIRRNKRGRPPLNRSLGIQRSDAFVKPLSDNASNHNMSDVKDVSDSESVYSRSNPNYHPRLAIHTNFKSFKRISKCHWSLKANRKMAAIAKKSKPLKKLLTSPKVGRPMKIKKPESLEYEHEKPYLSDQLHSMKATKLPLKMERDVYSNDENDDGNLSMHSNRHDLSREEEGKYWLEEINNKILKQKVKEAKRVQRKSKYNRRKMNQRNLQAAVSNPIIEDDSINYSEVVTETTNIKNEIIIVDKCDAIADLEKTDLVVGYEVSDPIVKKSKRGRKSHKQNTSYILSYKPSSIDDLKNDLMLISASLEEDKEKDVKMKDCVNDEYKECCNEVSTDGVIDMCVEHLSETINEPTEGMMMDNHVDDEIREITEDRIHRSKSKRRGLNKTNCSGKDLSRKASREERWVNIMWQRILKSEHSGDKNKRKRSKSSAAEDSIASEDNRNESSEIGSPKMGNSEISEDRDSSSNSKSSSAHKNRQKMKSYQVIESDTRLSDPGGSIKLTDCVDMKAEKSNNVSMASSGSVDECQWTDHKDISEQCGLIVYKEQHSNPMEKFSRENSAKLFTSDSYTEGVTISSNSTNTSHQHHTKKRWLSQALMDETFCETPNCKSDTTTDDDITNKLSSINNVSKRSFLPPVLTTGDNIDLLSSNIQKVAINPKKRLLNQFSMEDNALRTSVDDNLNDHFSIEQCHLEYNMSLSEPNTNDQEQSKIKLTLSEYRKRRFVNKPPNEFSNILLANNSSEFNDAWVGIGQLTATDDDIGVRVEKTKSDDIVSSTSSIKARDHYVKVKESRSHVSLSYIDTLNNLPMPSNVDPRLAKVHILKEGSSSPMINVDSLETVNKDDCEDVAVKEVTDPRSPLDTLKLIADDNLYRNGPRTPSETEDVINVVSQNSCVPIGHQSEGSVHSSESQPSPTSDSHFDLDKDTKALVESEKSTSKSSPWPSDWMSHPTIIGKLAGIKNPDLLQEIEEFDDEYIPMPENLPERTKEEIETLLLTQKRDSQIREWQEVKQLEREKVKLDHQVRSMERKLHRANRSTGVKIPESLKSHNSLEDGSKNPLANYDAKNDEKTMKTFNVQLANINDRLMEQINSLRTNDVSLKAGIQSDERSSLQLDSCKVVFSDSVTTNYSRHRKKLRLNGKDDTLLDSIVASSSTNNNNNNHTTTTNVHRSISPGSRPPQEPPSTQASEMTSTIV